MQGQTTARMQGQITARTNNGEKQRRRNVGGGAGSWGKEEALSVGEGFWGGAVRLAWKAWASPPSASGLGGGSRLLDQEVGDGDRPDATVDAGWGVERERNAGHGGRGDRRAGKVGSDLLEVGQRRGRRGEADDVRR